MPYFEAKVLFLFFVATYYYSQKNNEFIFRYSTKSRLKYIDLVGYRLKNAQN